MGGVLFSNQSWPLQKKGNCTKGSEYAIKVKGTGKPVRVRGRAFDGSFSVTKRRRHGQTGRRKIQRFGRKGDDTEKALGRRWK